MSFDDSKVVNGHIDWNLLTTAEQAELLAYYPIRRAGVNLSSLAPAAGITGDAVDPTFQQWLDGAYLQRHSTDTILDDLDQG